LNDLKLGIQKYHLLLQLIAINNNSISNECDMPCVNKLLQLIVDLMIHKIIFNKIAKVFIMPKYIFYDLTYAITISNTITWKWLRMFLATNSQPNDS